MTAPLSSPASTVQPPLSSPASAVQPPLSSPESAALSSPASAVQPPAAMTAPSSDDHLLRNLDAILADTAVEKLRSLVLHLAVQGRLLSRSPRSPLTPGPQPLSAPFGLPSGWVWRRVDEVGELQLGRQRSPPNHAGPHMRPYLRVANVFEARIDTSNVRSMNFELDEAERFLLRPNDVLLNEGQSYELVGRPALYRGEVPGACFQNTLIRFRPSASVIPEFALIVFRAYLRTGRFRREAQQTTNLAHLSVGRLAAVEFPLPPVDEQQRLVARVDHLLALCDQLQRQQTKQRAARCRFTRAALDALTATDAPQHVDAAWQRIAAHLDVLVDRADSVADLKRAILDAAIHGHFATRDPADRPAPDLLEQLRHERLAAGAPCKATDPTAGPFQLPPTWRWARLDQLWRSITDGDHQPPPKSVEGIALLTIGNVSRGTHDFTSTRHVPRSYFAKLDALRVPRRGDLLYTVVGSYGIPVLVTTDQPFCVQRHIAILKPLPSTNVPFLRYAMQSSVVYRQAQAAATGIAQPTVGLGVLRNLLVPLPPLAEQQRLVMILHKLMTICDALETKLRETETRADQLAEAALRELVL